MIKKDHQDIDLSSQKYHRYLPGQKRVSCWRKCAQELSQGKRKSHGLGYTQDESDIDSDSNILNFGDAFPMTELKNSFDSNESALENDKSNFRNTLKNV